MPNFMTDDGGQTTEVRRRRTDEQMTNDSDSLLSYPSSVVCRPLFPFQLDDLVRLGAAGGDDLDLGAFLLADEGPGERRGDGDLAFLGVGLGLADDLPHRFLVCVFVDQGDG